MVRKNQKDEAVQFILDALSQEQGKKKEKPVKYVIGDEFKVTDELSIIRQIIQGPVMICFWSDGTKTKSRCMDPDYFDYQVGLTVCICKKLLGEKTYYKLINKKVENVYEKDTAAKKKAAEDEDWTSYKEQFEALLDLLCVIEGVKTLADEE